MVWKTIKQRWEQGSGGGRSGELAASGALSRYRLVWRQWGLQVLGDIRAKLGRQSVLAVAGKGNRAQVMHGAMVSFPHATCVQLGKGKLRPAPLPAGPALSWVEQGDTG